VQRCCNEKMENTVKTKLFFLKVQFLDFLVSESYIHHQHPWISFQHNYLLALSGVQGLVLSRSIPPYAPRMHTRTHTHIYIIPSGNLLHSYWTWP
jgi:hypothetical protein